MIRRGDSLQTMRRDLDLSAAGSLTEKHMRARARKFTGPIAMSDLHGKVTAIGEQFAEGDKWVQQQYWVDRKANIRKAYNPSYASDWSYSLSFKSVGASNGLQFHALKESFSSIGDIGYGAGFFNIADPGNYRMRFSLIQDNPPGAIRFGVVEILGCTDGYISGNVEYLYRETTRTANPLTVDTTISVKASHPYVSPTFIAIVKNSAPGFTGCDCELAYLEITKI